MVILELTDEEFLLVRLAVAISLDKLSEEDKVSLMTLIKKFIAELKKQDECNG